MSQHLKAYGWFVLYMAVTKIVVKPIADSVNIPVLTTILG